MPKLLWFVGISMLMAAPAEAQFSQETMERVVKVACSEEKYISAPEEYLWKERCNYRFTHDGARVWFFYTNVLDFMESPCPSLKPWCERPYRMLAISVRWPHIDEPNFEEFITVEGLTGHVSFGVLQSAVRNDLRFDAGEPSTATREGRWPEGLAHKGHWDRRSRELIEVLLARDRAAPDS